MKYLLASILVGIVFLMGVAAAQTKPTTAPIVAPVPVVVPVVKKTGTPLVMLDATYLWNDQTKTTNAPGLGIGAPYCRLIGLSSGEVRDDQGKIISRRPMLEPTIDVGVLAEALRPFPQGGRVILDAEGATSYWINEAALHADNVKGFAQWKLYIEAVRFVRPDLKISPIISWHSPNLNPIQPTAWAESEACAAIFKSDILPLIDSLAIELYYFDRTSPPATGDADSFNMWGVLSQPGWGFQFNCGAEHNYARALTGKPAVHVFCVTPGDPSRPETSSKFLSGPRMAACLDQIALYAPSAVVLWGSAANQNPHTLPDGYVIGTFDPHADWLKEVSKRMK